MGDIIKVIVTIVVLFGLFVGVWWSNHIKANNLEVVQVVEKMENIADKIYVGNYVYEYLGKNRDSYQVSEMNWRYDREQNTSPWLLEEGDKVTRKIKRDNSLIEVPPDVRIWVKGGVVHIKYYKVVKKQ